MPHRGITRKKTKTKTYSTGLLPRRCPTGASRGIIKKKKTYSTGLLPRRCPTGASRGITKTYSTGLLPRRCPTGASRGTRGLPNYSGSSSLNMKSHYLQHAANMLQALITDNRTPDARMSGVNNIVLKYIQINTF